MARTGPGTVIGAIDLGGTKVGVGVATSAGDWVARSRFDTRPARGSAAVLAEAVAHLQALIPEGETLTAVGVGCVGPLDPATGVMTSPPNFPGWGRVPVRAILAAKLGVPVTIDNDANVAALAEFRAGAGRGARVMLFATISTGIGGGIVIDGRLLHGLGGAAGEIGHQTVKADGPLCGCGNRGCLEALVAGPAIVARARTAIDKGHGGGILAAAGGTVGALMASHVGVAAAGGDAAAGRIWDEVVSWLAIGLGNCLTILAPDRLVLGGGVAVAAGENLLLPLQRALADRVRMLPVGLLELRLAELGDEAGLHGAAALVS